MPEQLRKIIDKVLEWWKKFNTKQRALLISITAVVILSLVILAVLISRPSYVELIACEDSAQAAEVKDLLDSDSSIDYKVDSNMVVSVDKDDEVTATMLLGQNDIPSDGYSITNVTGGSLSTTASDKEKLWEDYLEKKYASDLSELSFVNDAIVDVDLPDDDGTILSKDEEGTAAVTLDLESEITEEQAYAIARMVATEMGNSSTTGITVIDSDANILYSGADQNSTTGIASSQLTYKEKQENLIKDEITETLTDSGVFSNIEIAMNLDINFDSVETAEKNYSHPEGGDESYKDSESLYDSSATNGSAAVPGTSSNDGDVYYTDDSEYSEQTISDYDYDYIDDEKVTKTTSNGGKIVYDDSSVSIVATRYVVYKEELLEKDGTLDDMTWEEFKAQNGDTVKVEDTDADTENMIEMIRTATGFQTSNITFMVYETPTFIDKESSSISLTDIFQILLAVLIFALLGFVVFKSLRTAKEEEPEPELSVESLLESTAENQEALEDIGYSEKSEARILIEKFVDENPEAVALLLRNWLNEDWE